MFGSMGTGRSLPRTNIRVFKHSSSERILVDVTTNCHQTDAHERWHSQQHLYYSPCFPSPVIYLSVCLVALSNTKKCITNQGYPSIRYSESAQTLGAWKTSPGRVLLTYGAHAFHPIRAVHPRGFETPGGRLGRHAPPRTSARGPR